MEKDYTLKISQYIHNRLNDLGIQNTLTRDSDVTLEPKDRVNKILDAYGNGQDVVVVSNHVNAGGEKDSCSKITFFEKNVNKDKLLNKLTFLLYFKT